MQRDLAEAYLNETKQTPERSLDIADAYMQAEKLGNKAMSINLKESVNPDDAAKAKRLSIETGFPTDLVTRNLPDIDAESTANKYATTLDDSPKLKQRLATDGNFTSIARDDIERLSSLEKMSRKLGTSLDLNSMNYSLNPTPGIVDFVKNEYKRGDLQGVGTRALRSAGLNKVGDELTNISANLTDAFKKALPAMESAGLTAQAELVETFLKPLIYINKRLGIIDQTPAQVASLLMREARLKEKEAQVRPGSLLMESSEQGVQSVGVNAPGMVTSAVTGKTLPGLVWAGTMASSPAYLKYREKGLDPWSSLYYSSTQGLTEAAFEMLPLKGLIGSVQEGETYLKTLFKQLKLENVTEQATTVVQDLTDYMALQGYEDKTFGDFLRERPEAAVRTLIATSMGTTLQTSVLHPLSNMAKDFGVESLQAAQGISDHSALDELKNEVLQSIVRTRSPEAFGEFAQEIGDGKVFLKAKEFENVFNQSGSDMAEFMIKAPETAKQLSEAVELNTDLVIPRSEYINYFSEKEFTNELLPYMKATIDGMTSSDSLNHFENGIEEIISRSQEVYDEGVSKVKFQASANKVHELILEQLNKAEPQYRKENSVRALGLKGMYSLVASNLKRSGKEEFRDVTPEIVMEMYPTLIQSENVPETLMSRIGSPLKTINRIWEGLTGKKQDVVSRMQNQDFKMTPPTQEEIVADQESDTQLIKELTDNVRKKYEKNTLGFLIRQKGGVIDTGNDLYDSMIAAKKKYGLSPIVKKSKLNKFGEETQTGIEGDSIVELFTQNGFGYLLPENPSVADAVEFLRSAKNLDEVYPIDVIDNVNSEILDAEESVKSMRDRIYSLRRGDTFTSPDSTSEFNEEDLMFQTSFNAPTFFSKMARVSSEKLPNKGTASQFKQTLESFVKKGEFKQEEYEWSGISAWLDEQPGKITKEDVLDYMRENTIQMEEVVKGHYSDTGMSEEIAISKWLDDADAGVREEDGYFIASYGGGDIKSEYDTEEEAWDALRTEAKDQIEEFENFDTTKYSEYTLPGKKEGYTELLITLPNRKLDIEDSASRFYADWVRLGGEPTWDELSDDKKKEIIGRMPPETKKASSYRSSHWDEPNVLAFVRFDERTDADGNRVLFLEEVQSDWHQEGRKNGYNIPLTNEEKEELKNLREENSRLHSQMRSADEEEFDILNEKRKPILEKIREMENRSNGANVPDAPFKKTWHELALKRMLRYAAENGFDKLAWTTGEQQAERYDLSKQVDSVEYNSGSKVLRAYKDNKPIIREENVSVNELEKYIGKEASKKLIEDGKLWDNKEGGSSYALEGEDLKVGGEGMKGFYDKMIPSFLNKYTKKWGAKVGDTELAGSVKVHSVDITQDMSDSVLEEGQFLFQKAIEEEKDLAVIHNLTAKNLIHASKMGGLPVPSIAVIKIDKPMSGFGEITLISDPSMADSTKDSSVKLFDVDIYSPRYPEVSLVIDQKKLDSTLEDIAAIAPEFGDEIKRISVDDSKRGLDSLSNNEYLKYAFLKSIGKSPKIKYKKSPVLPKELRKFKGKTDRFKLEGSKEFRDAVREVDIQNTEKYILALPEEQQNSARNIENEMRNDEVMDRLVRKYSYQVVASNQPMEVDFYALRDSVEKAMKKNGDKYMEWIDDEFSYIVKSERIFTGFTYSGTRKYVEHNLDNVVRILKSGLKSGESFNYGVGNIRASHAKQLKGLKAIRKERDRIVSSEEMQVYKDKSADMFDSIAESLKNKYRFDASGWSYYDDVSKAMGEVARKGKRAIDEVYQGLNEDEYRLIFDFIDELRNAPTEYFEAKVQRVVSLNEFIGAVVPKNTPQKAIDILNKNGIKVKFYDPNKSDSRSKAMGSFKNLLFQKSKDKVKAFITSDFGVNNETIMRLTSASDITSFMHETAHIYLKIMTDLAGKPNVPDTILDELNTTFEWMGLSGINEWNSMTFKQQRPYHEKFARGFEAYLMEGKAPTKKLKNVFRRFKEWFIQIYKDIEQFKALHGIELSDDIRNVFARIIAGSDQINETSRSLNHKPMFTTKPEGMTQAMYEEYLALDVEATDISDETIQARLLRDMRWLSGAKDKALKAEQAKVNKIRRTTMEQVKKEVEAMPIYKAWRYLTELPDGEKEVGRMSVSGIKEIFMNNADNILKTSPLNKRGKYGMVTKEDHGLHPDFIAGLFGFSSGYELVNTLINTTPPDEMIRQLTDERMIYEHGDIGSSEAMKEAAIQAVHNEARIRLMTTELNTFEAMTGKPRTLTDKARITARSIIGNTSIRDLQPHKFRLAAERASKASIKAFKKGDLETAVNEKRIQVMNSLAVVEAYRAKDKVAKGTRLAKRIMKGKDAEVAKRRDFTLVSLCRVILGEHGLGNRTSERALDYLKLVREYDQESSSMISSIIVSINEYPSDFRDFSVSQMTNFFEDISDVWDMSIENKAIEIDGKRVDLGEVVTALNGRIDEMGKKPKELGKYHAVTKKEKRVLSFGGLTASMSRVSHWVERMDGNDYGVFKRFIWTPISEAATAYRKDSSYYHAKFKKLLDPIKNDLTRAKIVSPEDELNYTFGMDESKTGGMSELLHAILHTGNSSNKRKLLLGRGWGELNEDGTINDERWQSFLNRLAREGILEKRHFDFVQGVWDLMEEMKPKAQTTYKKAFGRYFAEITAELLVTPFGEYKGGYVPAQTDPRIVEKAGEREIVEAENNSMQYSFPSTPKGFTNERVENYTKPLHLDLGKLGSHIDKVSLFTNMTIPVRDVTKILNNEDFRSALNGISPSYRIDMLIPWLNRSARQQISEPVVGEGGKWIKVFGRLRRNAGMTAMFANVANSMQQFTGGVLALVKVKPKYMLGAVTDYIQNPLKFTEDAVEMSDYLSDRMFHQIGIINDEIKQILVNQSVYENVENWTLRHAYFMQTAVDNVMSPIVWRAAYDESMANTPKDELDPHKRAVRIANDVVRGTMGAMAPEDISRMEGGNDFVRMFTQFAGYFNMNANLLGTEFSRLTKDNGFTSKAGRGLYVFFFGFLAPAIVGEAIIQVFRGGVADDDSDGEYLDDWLMALLFGTFRYATAMIPGIGQTANAAVNAWNNKPYDDRISTAPAISMIETGISGTSGDFYKAFVEGKEVKTSKAIRDISTLVGVIFGLPALPATKPIRYLSDVSEGRVVPVNEADVIRGMMTGVASPESKR